MTRLVAVDTSTWWGGVALVRSGDCGTVVAEAGLRVRDSHAAHLLSLLERLLAEAGWSRDVVDAYAACRGPGSFTGLRVGLGTIRGLALGAGRPCVGVGTLDAMAEAVGPVGGDRVPLLDAGRGEVYGARFDASSRPPRVVRPPWLGPPERCLEGEREPVVFGPGAEAYAERLRQAGWTGHHPRTPTTVAAAAGRLALGMLARGCESGEGMAPLYVRPPDAQLKSCGR